MMRAAGLVLLLAAPAAAQTLPDAEAAVLPRILSAVSVEISGQHIGAETAILLRSADADGLSADLAILAGVPDDRAGQPVVLVRDLVYAGTMAGQVPWLEVSPSGSLLIHSEQTGIGRSPWENTLTVAERDGVIRAAGYTLRSWDRVTGRTAVCDWNLLTGGWTLNTATPQDSGPDQTQHRSGRTDLTVSLADWAPEVIPDQCSDDQSD